MESHETLPRLFIRHCLSDSAATGDRTSCISPSNRSGPKGPGIAVKSPAGQWCVWIFLQTHEVYLAGLPQVMFSVASRVQPPPLTCGADEWVQVTKASGILRLGNTGIGHLLKR